MVINSMFIGIDISKYKIFCSSLDSNSNIYGSFETIVVPIKDDVERGYRVFEFMREYLVKMSDEDDTLIIYAEHPIYVRNIRTSFDIARNYHSIQLACFELGFPCYGVDPAHWKKIVLGNGKAVKEDIMKFVKTRWPNHFFDNQDVMDASCIALYGYFMMNIPALKKQNK